MTPWPSRIRQTGNARLWTLPAAILFILPLSLLLTSIPAILVERSTNPPVNGTATVLALTGQTMGTRYHIQIALPESHVAGLPEDLDLHIEERLRELDRDLFSTYSPDSQVSRFNALAADHKMVVSDELILVLATAGQIHRLSGGAFDISIKPLVDLWGFGSTAQTQGMLPSASDIEEARTKMGMTRLILDRDTRSIGKTGDVSIDLSAIAKGYAVDVIASLLASEGINNYLVEIGGELASSGSKGIGTPWKVGIETPAEGTSSLFQAVNVGERPIALAASGNYRNYFKLKGQEYSHLINPLTGAPVTHDLASVTVISDTAMQADAWATALSVLGPDEGVELANQLQLAAYFIVADDEGFRQFHTDAFNAYLQ